MGVSARAPLFGIFPKISTTVEITVEKPDRDKGGARMVVSFPAISRGQPLRQKPSLATHIL
jgi:hypothetical protein